MVFIKKVKTGDKVYFYFVESYRKNGKIMHKMIRRLTPEEEKDQDIALNKYREELNQKTGIKGIILAAGNAPRLYPLTIDNPATLVNIGNKSILEYLLDSFYVNNIQNIVVIGGYKFNKIKDKFSQLELIYNPFYRFCKSLGSLYFVKEYFNTELILTYGDILFPPSVLKKLLDHSSSDIVIVASEMHHDHEAEKIMIRNNNLTTINKETSLNESSSVFMGLSKFTAKGAKLARSVLDELILEDSFDIHHYSIIFERLVQKGIKVEILKVDEPWMDLDFPYRVKEAERDILPYFIKK